MRRICTIAVLVGVLTVGVVSLTGQAPAGWTTLFDGKNLTAFNTIGDANWQLMDGVVQANKGTGFLVTKTSFTDFQTQS
jgi:hypothetical protein